MAGPKTLARPQTKLASERVLPRSSGGAMSASTMYTRAKLPPAPMPCKARQAIRNVMLCAKPAARDAAINIRIETIYRVLV